MSEETLDLNKLGVYLVEGIAEVDPLTERVTVRTVNSNGEPLDFDPIPAIASLKGQEIRLVIVPLASVTYLEEVARKATEKGDTVVVADPPILADPKAN